MKKVVLAIMLVMLLALVACKKESAKTNAADSLRADSTKTEQVK